MTTTIGIDAHVLTGKFQGTRTTLRSLIQAMGPYLEDRRIILYTNDPTEAANMVNDNRFEYHSLKSSNAFSRLFKEFPKLFSRDKVDIGVFQYISASRGRNIVFIHDILPITHKKYFSFKMRLRTWLLFSLSIRRAAMVLVVSEDTRRAVASRYRLPPERLRTVLNGPSFPVDTYAGERTPAADRYIMTVGRIEQRKQIPLLIEAFMKANLPDVRLIIVGSFDFNFSFDRPDDPRIEIRQGLSDDALIDLYRGASLFVYPSAAEGFGIPLLDATLFGLPVISSDRTAMPEVAGTMAQYFNPEADTAAATLSTMIHNHFRGNPIPCPTIQQREAQAQKFSWDRAARMFLNASDKIVARDNA
jgi:glycosyltransferase involved in cell wall biosynthesis